MTTKVVSIHEDDVVRLALEFLHNRDLHITQLSLERETGIINGNFSNELLFFRQLILDGQWENVLDFIKPFEEVQTFQENKVKFLVLRQKIIELLCIKSEIKTYNNVEGVVEDIVNVLRSIEKIAPSKEEYNKLCLLLTLPSITDHTEFKKWNPSNARVQCFREVYPYVKNFFTSDKKSGSHTSKSSMNDRLMQLLKKGLLYEFCVNCCQSRASSTDCGEVNTPKLLDYSTFNESDSSLLSWLQVIPSETFNIPFENKKLAIEVVKMERPSLHTSWTEHMFVTPIKPPTFPHLNMPFKRPQSAADAMTRSLRPLPEGAPRPPPVMALSSMDYGPSSSCFAGFHLKGMTGIKVMNKSVDLLFEDNNYDSVMLSGWSKLLPSKKPLQVIGESPKPADVNESNAVTPEQRSQESPSTSLSNASITHTSIFERSPGIVATSTPEEQKPGTSNSHSHKNELLKEFQLQKQRECDEYLRNLRPSESRLNSSMESSPIAESSLQEGSPGNREARTSKSARRLTIDENSFVNLNVAMNESQLEGTNDSSDPDKNIVRPTFKPVTVLEDAQPVRCAEFHPNGKLYAVGANTKTLRICTYPKIDDFKDDSEATAPVVLLKRTKHHKGSIYCLAWSPEGDLLATGSNDKTIKLMKFNTETCNLEGQETELLMHDGTVRDVCFIEDTTNKASLLVSGGAGDCKIYVTDCATGKPFKALTGHSGHVSSLYNWGGAVFVSGSQDKTVRFWDLRTARCVDIVYQMPGHPTVGSPVASTAVDPSGRLLVSGYEDGICNLYDIRGSRSLQRFTPHTSDLRSVRFSPGAYYLLTAGYDERVVLTDLQGDLTCPLPSVLVARHRDKVISARWHPEDFSFLSTAADKTAVLWTIPPK